MIQCLKVIDQLAKDVDVPVPLDLLAYDLGKNAQAQTRAWADGTARLHACGGIAADSFVDQGKSPALYTHQMLTHTVGHSEHTAGKVAALKVRGRSL